MGPITLFDKSFLQALNVDEAMWFDHFFLANICPIFYVETLADLEKPAREGRTPEQEVGFIADKTPYMRGMPCTYHGTLCLGELLGNRVPMTGQIPVSGGRPVKSDGKSGVVFDEAPEAQAFTRWQRGEFLELERHHARAWREALRTLDLPALAEKFRALGITGKNCNSLAMAKDIASGIVRSKEKPFDRIAMAFNLLDIPRQYHVPIMQRWSVMGYPSFFEFAPYVSHVLEVEIFFQVALAANQISSERASNRADVAYLFYLPFCTAFVSSDNLHRRCAPLFMKPDQDFLWGHDLKADLKQTNVHFQSVPDEVKAKGIMAFAHHPPGGEDSLMVQLWDRHSPGWRKVAANNHVFEPTRNSKLAAGIKRMTQARPLADHEIDFDPIEADSMAIQRFASKRRGNWWQLPSDLKNEEGPS